MATIGLHRVVIMMSRHLDNANDVVNMSTVIGVRCVIQRWGMAQKFSKPFYNSKAWQQIREYILKRDNYMCQCEECKGEKEPADEVHHIIWLNRKNIHDPMIALHESNLMSINRDCHFRTHKQQKIHGTKKKSSNYGDVIEGYEFDENGYVVESK